MHYNQQVQVSFGEYLLKVLPIYTVNYEKGELTITVPHSKIFQVIQFLRDNTKITELNNKHVTSYYFKKLNQL